MTYKILVHHPNGEKPTLEYLYEDMNQAEEGMGFLAIWHIKLRDGVRRMFEIVPVPPPEPEVEDVPTDPASGADPEPE